MEISVSVILPVINETFSLRETVEKVYSDNSGCIREFLIVTCSKTTASSREEIKKLKENYNTLIHHFEQQLPFLGGAIRDAFEKCSGTHVVMMASDLETEPALVKDFIKLTAQDPDRIVTATRWKGGGFKGYHPVKLIFNWIFQKFFSLLYRTNLSDMTYGFRIFPSELVKKINWEELRHPFLFESILKPLKLKVRVIEIPSRWEARKEGESQNPFFRNFSYFKTGIKILISGREKILKK